MEFGLAVKDVLDYVVKDEDTQRQTVYDRQKRLCAPLSGEVLDREAAQSVKKALWERHVDLPVRPPSMQFDESAEEHSYYAWEHQITLNAKKAPTIPLIHELAHAKLGALGIGPFVESHGPLFLRIFGKMWSTYSAKPYETFADRTEDLQIANSLPDLSEHTWAVVVEGGREYAVRPAQKAVEIGWNIDRTFSLNVKENHPYGS